MTTLVGLTFNAGRCGRSRHSRHRRRPFALTAKRGPRADRPIMRLIGDIHRDVERIRVLLEENDGEEEEDSETDV